jgi:hypothetical protein
VDYLQQSARGRACSTGSSGGSARRRRPWSNEARRTAAVEAAETDEEADDFDEADGAALDQGAASARPKKLSRLQKA